MFHRFAVMIAATAMAASSVAPAQVVPQSASAPKPATIAMNVVIPATPAALPVTTPTANDPLAPLVGEQQPAVEVEEPAEEISPGATLAETVAKLRGTDPGSRDLECLAAGIYFESKSEPLAGQLAVGQVIANRASSNGRFPSSYCGVLFQRGQFSFVRGGRWPAIAKSGLQWKNAVAIAKIVDKDLHDSSVGKALFFHARRVSPGWRLKRVATVGNHVFYR